MRWLPLGPETLEELANQNEKRLARMQELPQILPTLEGVGYAADERIKVTVKDGAALSGLTLAPCAWTRPPLAESIVEAAQAATAVGRVT
jgi:hypothetical protein